MKCQTNERFGSKLWAPFPYTYIVNSINEGIIATIAHCKPITAKPNYIYVPIPEIKALY